MLVRVALAVTFSVAAYTFQHLKSKQQCSDNSADLEHEDEKEQQNEVYKEDLHAHNDVDSAQKEEEEEEEVKRVNSVLSPSLSSKSFSDGEQILLPEFEDLLSSSLEFPSEKGSLTETSCEKASLSYEATMDSNSAELNRLRNLVKELEEREVTLEGELLEYYGMKEQETRIGELQRQLQIKVVEIDMLNIKVNSLETQKKKMEEEVAKAMIMKKELEVSRTRIKELQRQIQIDSAKTKEHLLMLKQQVATLQAKEKEASKKDFETEKKLQNLKELDVEVVELRRTNRELQHEKRELTVKLDAAEAQITTLSNMTESEMVMKEREEANTLRHATAVIFIVATVMQVPLHCQTNNNNMDPLAVGFRNHHLFSFYCGKLQFSLDRATSVDAAVGNGHHTLEARLIQLTNALFQELQDKNDPEFVTAVISLFFQDSEKQLGNLANALYVSCAGPYSTIFFKLGKRTWQKNLIMRQLITRKSMPICTSSRESVPGAFNVCSNSGKNIICSRINCNICFMYTTDQTHILCAYIIEINF